MTVAATRAPQAPVREPRQRHFPSALTVLLVVTVSVWLLAFVVPTGKYALDANGRPVPGSYGPVDADLSFVDLLYQLFLAPVTGCTGSRAPRRASSDRTRSGSSSVPQGCSCSCWPSGCSSR